MSLTEIKNFVTIGGRIATGGQPTEDQLRDAMAAGYEVVINLGLLDRRYCLPDEPDLVRTLGMEYHHIPVQFDDPDIRDFHRFVDVMDEVSHQTVFVHCALNHRVSVFMALYGQARLGWSREDADDHIRRVWEPDATWRAFLERGRQMLRFRVRPATAIDVAVVSGILSEAASWLAAEGMPMWRADELAPARLASDVAAGFFWVGDMAGEAAGTIKFQLTDPEFWPDVRDDESAFVHRLAVRRRFAGGLVSFALLTWARERAADLGLRYLRLDCEASRLRLRAVYERFGFQHHSDRQVGPYFVSRYEMNLGLGRGRERWAR